MAIRVIRIISRQPRGSPREARCDAKTPAPKQMKSLTWDIIEKFIDHAKHNFLDVRDISKKCQYRGSAMFGL
jgi:hypothetical protein